MNSSSVARTLAYVAAIVSLVWVDLSGLQAAAATGTGTARRVLPDGSIVQLENRATIMVEFSNGMRRVMLHNGEAHFTVRQDRLRPFVVKAGGVDFRAVGTVFSVSYEKFRISVAVTEGRVAVSKPHRETIAIAQPGNPVLVLDFQNTPLAEAVTVFNQYAPVRLVIRDPSLAALQITTTMLADNSDSLLTLLREAFHIRTERDGDEISLRRAR